MNFSFCKCFFASALVAFAIIVASASSCFAQASAFYAQFFQDRYLTNPAMAGLDKGFNLDLGYQQQFTAVSGSPKIQYLTADYNVGGNVGLGFNLNSGQDGLINTTRVMGTYAYHVPLSLDDKLNFGLSLGVNDSYIDDSKIQGDQNDLSVYRFNQRTIYFDGDLGASYTSNQLNVQLAIPNLKTLLFKNNDEQNLQADRSVFYSAVSYKMESTADDNGFTIEPLVAFRGFKNAQSILDAGANFDFPQYDFNLSGMYHTNQSATFALGLTFSPVDAFFAYSLNMAQVTTLNNTFEIGLKIKL